MTEKRMRLEDSADVFEVAVEHIAWCVRTGMTPAEVFACLETEPPQEPPQWIDATWAVAAAYDIGREIQFRLRMRAASRAIAK